MTTSSTDQELEAVVQEILGLDPDGDRTAMVLRSTLDQLYDGLHTGRYRWDQLHKTEKTHCGTLVEINLQREFKFADGVDMDYQIAGVDVDCKYSQSMGGWMIPPESMGHLCMVVTADDQQSSWSLGVVRITDDILSQGGNRDRKRSITAAGRNAIHWVFPNRELTPNVLLHLDREVVDRIMQLSSGQKRINEIFRVAQRQVIGRGVIATLGQQDDYMKRVRGNGGSRTQLRPEGIVILGHFDGHRRIAQELNIPVPNRGELVSVRLALAEQAGDGVASIGGELWRVAVDGDAISPAPDCPHH